MKIRYLFLASLILIMLTIGASAASQNISASLEDVVSDDDSLSLGENDLQEVLFYQSGDVNVYCNANADDSPIECANINADNSGAGTVSPTSESEGISQNQYSLNDEVSLISEDLQKQDNSMTYPKSVEKSHAVTKQADSTYEFKVWIGDDDFANTNYKFMDQVFFSLPDDAKGTLYLKINDKSFKVKVKSPLTVFTLKKAGLKVGTYTLKATFKDSNNNYGEKTVSKKITVTPTVEYSSQMSVGEKDPIIVTAHKGAKITAILYKTDKNDRKIKIKSYSSTTSLKIPVDRILVKGYNSFYLKVTCAKQTNEEYITIDVQKNHAKIKASVTKSRDSAKITIKSPKSDSYMYIYLDGKHVKSINLKKGNVKTALSSLSVGKHKIKLLHDGVRFYSNTFYITVKKADKVSISLKNVNVKKSAKKLVLNATVKYNKKLVAKKKVTFKFNGKKYTVKSDKYGVAKLKISKKVLKKLQTGKKYRYSVTYVKKSASKKVLVER